MKSIKSGDFGGTVRSAANSGGGGGPSSSAGDLSIETILSMVLEGLERLKLYRAAAAIGDAEGQLAARHAPRPLFEANSTKRLGYSGNHQPLSDSMNKEPSSSSESREAPSGTVFGTATYDSVLMDIRRAFSDEENVLTAEEEASKGNEVSPARGRATDVGGGRRKPKREGISEALFCEFVAPALTLTRDPTVNRRFVAQTNVTQSGRITWDDFSNFFVLSHGEAALESTQVKIVKTMSHVQHNTVVRKILFSKPRMFAESANPALDRYCITGGYDGTVHLWDTAFYDHACRVHYIPTANKAKRWITDMSFTGSGRLAISQSRGFVYMYSFVNPLAPFLHRVFRSASSLSEDEEVAVRLELEHVRMLQGKTRFNAADIPLSDVCVMSSPSPGDIVAVYGPRTLSRFSTSGHVEPLLVGLDTGLVHLYNVHRPIEFRAQVAPMETYSGFAKGGEVFQIADNACEPTFFCAGRNLRGSHCIEVVDYETFTSSLSLQCSSHQPQVPFRRFDFDETISLLIACGASRSAPIFSSSFPNPVAFLTDHSAPLVGASINAVAHQIVTYSEDNTFHLFDIRMFRKVQTFAAGDTTKSPSGLVERFSCAAFDGTAGTPVAAASSPTALVMQGISTNAAVWKSAPSSGGDGGNAGDAAAAVASTFRTPSGLATELRQVLVTQSYNSLLAAEGSHIITRNLISEDEVMSNQLIESVATLAFAHTLTGSPSKATTAISNSERPPYDMIATLPETIISMCLDDAERRLAVLVPGRQVFLIAAAGGGKLGSWTCTSLEKGNECTVAAFSDKRTQEEPVLVVGTLGGDVLVFDVGDETGKQLLHLKPGGTILCATSLAHHKVLLGTSAGDMFVFHADTFVCLPVLTFSAAHSGRDHIAQGVKEPPRRRSLRGESLDHFRAKAHAAMDTSVEAIEKFDGSHCVALYGTGLVLLLRVTSAEVIIVATFPSVETHTSASAIGTCAGSLRKLVVGDFNGNLNVFTFGDALSPMSMTASRAGGGALMDFSSGSIRSGGGGGSGTPSHQRYFQYDRFGQPIYFDGQFCLSSKSFISDVYVVESSELIVAGLAELASIVVLRLSGEVVAVHTTNPLYLSLPEWLMLQTELETPHPFVTEPQQTRRARGDHSSRATTGGVTVSMTVGDGNTSLTTMPHSRARSSGRGQSPGSADLSPKHGAVEATGGGHHPSSSSSSRPQLMIVAEPPRAGGGGIPPSSSEGRTMDEHLLNMTSTSDGLTMGLLGNSTVAARVIPKPLVAMPKGTPRLLSASHRVSPRTVQTISPRRPSNGGEVDNTNQPKQEIAMIANCEVHPSRGTAFFPPDPSALVTALGRPRPGSAKSVNMEAINALSVPKARPQSPTSSPANQLKRAPTRPVTANAGTAQRPSPLIHYEGLSARVTHSTSDMDRLRPPSYVESRAMRPPATPTFPYQRKTEEMSSRTETLLQAAVDTANNISGRIVGNLRQRRLLRGTYGGRTGDGRVFLTLDQQPLPPAMVQLALQASQKSKRGGGH